MSWDVYIIRSWYPEAPPHRCFLAHAVDDKQAIAMQREYEARKGYHHRGNHPGQRCQPTHRTANAYMTCAGSSFARDFR